MESMILRLYSLDGDFKTISKIEVSSLSEARQIVEKHIAGSGYWNLKTVDDEDSLWFTATTPAGRAGRNVAVLEF